MLTNRARFAIIAVAVILLIWTAYVQVYEISAMVAAGILYLIYGYFKEGTVVLAAKAYHQQNYEKAEGLLNEIKNPEWLKKSRRGYYEVMLGNIELKREALSKAEMHFQIASRFQLKNQNEKALVLVQLANLNIRKKEFKKSQAYIDIAKDLKISPRVNNIIEKIEIEIKKGRD